MNSLRIFFYFLLLITNSLFPVFSFSQNPFKAGIIAGIAATQVDGDGYSGFDKAGIAAGGFVSNNFGSENWMGQMELLYVEKGSRRPPNPEKGINYYKISLSYVEIPLLARYKRKRLVYEGGLSFGRLVRHREEDTSGELTPLEYYPFKKYEVALNIGLNYRVNDRLSIEARSVRSVLPVRGYAVFTQFGFFGLTSSGIFGGSYNTVLAYTLRYHFGNNTETVKKNEASKNIVNDILKIE